MSENNVLDFSAKVRESQLSPNPLSKGPGGPYDGDMERRVRELEKGHAVVVERIDSLEKRIDQRFDGVDLRFDSVDQRFDGVGQRFDGVAQQFDGIDRRFDRLEAKIDKLPGEWAMAKVVFFVAGSLMAAAVWGPRLLTLTAGP